MPPVRGARRPARPPTRPTAPAAGSRRVGASPSRGLKTLAFGVVGLFIVALAAIVYVMWQIAAGGSGATARASAPLVIPPNAQRFASYLDFERTAPKAGTQFAVSLTEAELNARLGQALARQPDLPFKDVKATVLDDRIDFTGKTRAVGLDLSAVVGLALFADNGRLAYDIQSIDFGPVPVPGPARGAIQESIDRQLAGQRLTEGFIVDGIQARRGAVTIVGRMR